MINVVRPVHIDMFTEEFIHYRFMRLLEKYNKYEKLEARALFVRLLIEFTSREKEGTKNHRFYNKFLYHGQLSGQKIDSKVIVVILDRQNVFLESAIKWLHVKNALFSCSTTIIPSPTRKRVKHTNVVKSIYIEMLSRRPLDRVDSSSYPWVGLAF